jgi:hypothetical protein
MAWSDQIQIAGKLRICESSASGAVALPGTTNHATPYPSDCAKARHQQTNWLAHVSAHVFHTSEIDWR